MMNAPHASGLYILGRGCPPEVEGLQLENQLPQSGVSSKVRNRPRSSLPEGAPPKKSSFLAFGELHPYWDNGLHRVMAQVTLGCHLVLTTKGPCNPARPAPQTQGGHFSRQHGSNDGAHKCPWAIYWVLQKFLLLLKGRHVLVQSDNKSAVYHVNHQGGTSSTLSLQVARQLLIWAFPRFFPTLVPCNCHGHKNLCQGSGDSTLRW